MNELPVQTLAIPVQGGALHGVQVGTSGQPVIVLHGGPGASHDYLRPQLDAFATNQRRLIYYDQRGSGLSRGEFGEVSYQDHVADLDKVRDFASAETAKPTLIIGYSWGALLALLYALDQPSKVAGLVLVGTAPLSMSERKVARVRMDAQARRPETEAFKQTLDLHDRRQRFALAVSGYFFDPQRSLELTPFLVRAAVEQSVWRSLGDYDVRSRLRELSLPALVIHGREDPIPAEFARKTATGLHAEYVEIPACGHVPYIEGARQFFPAVERFLAQFTS